MLNQGLICVNVKRSYLIALYIESVICSSYPNNINYMYRS